VITSPSGSSSLDPPPKTPSKDRERSPAQITPATASLQKAASNAGVATPRKREKKAKDKDKDDDVIRRLQQICTDADPTKLYRNLVKIGAG
jgi:p21-activated kinase 1